MQQDSVGPFARDEFLTKLAADSDAAARDVSNHVMFSRYVKAGRGVLLDRDDRGLWDIHPVDGWDDAFYAERRRDRENSPA